MRLTSMRTVFTLFVVFFVSMPALGLDADPGGHPVVDLDSFAARQGLMESARALGRDGSPGLQMQRLDGVGAPDSLHAVVLLCAFADSLFYSESGPADQTQTTLPFAPYSANDVHYFDHQMSDVADYFNDVSGGRFTFDYEIVPDVIVLPQAMGWYGDHPEFGEYRVGLAVDAVAAVDPVVDFSRFDTVVLIHAGAGEETDILGNSPEQIYSGYIGPEDFAEAAAETLITTPYIPTNDVFPDDEPVNLKHVLVLPENEFQDPFQGYGGYFGSLGVYCFEVGLRLGMLSLSDFTPEGIPDSQGIGEFGLMGYGLFVGAGYVPDHPCAFNKVLMGWLDPIEVAPAAAAVWELPPAEDGGGGCARVDISGREYWLLEYRLQDPDGNGVFSFPGDLNGNGVPDFYDADSSIEGSPGVPDGTFDPLTDTHESLRGAEFDFFMSENSARAQGVKGAGSGLYIWHVDEGVVRDAFADGSRLFNSDARRKAVDLEEADGIQDLDTRQGTPFVLGGDDDAFRGEGVDAFGPDTLPATDSAGGAWTGVLIADISDVVAAVGELTLTYADSMTFRCSLVSGIEEASPDATVELPGVDLTGSHLLAVDLDSSGDDQREILVAADGGRVLAFDHELGDYLPAPAEKGLFALGTDAEGEPVEWIGPPAAGDVDRDGIAEVVLAAANGIYVFNGEDGSEYADGDGDPDSRGLYLALAGIDQPPVLLPRSDLPEYADILLAYLPVASLPSLMRIDVAGDDDAILMLPESASSFAAPPLVWGGTLWGLTVGEEPGAAILQTAGRTVDLPVDPSGAAPLVSANGMLIAGEGGTAVLITDPASPVVTLWDAAGPLSPPAPGTAFVGDGVFVVSGSTGAPALGWPCRPSPSISSFGTEADDGRSDSDAGIDGDVDGAGVGAGACAVPSPLVIEDEDGEWHYLFTARDGRIFQYDSRGNPAPGFPLSGPGDAAGTSLWADLDQDSRPEVAAAGTFLRLAGIDPDSGEPVTEPISRISLWHRDGPVVGNEIWPQWGGNPLRSGTAPQKGSTAPGGDGLLDPESRICYPNPLAAGPLHVRALAWKDCSFRAILYNLEGEQVVASASVSARAEEPVEVLLEVDKAASGVYLCRLVAQGDGRTEESIHPVAIER